MLTDMDEKVDELTEFMASDEAELRCEIKHTRTTCQHKVVARRRFRCRSDGFNMCASATENTRISIAVSAIKCGCGTVVGECWFIIDI